MKLPADLLESLQNVPGFDKEAFIAVHESSDQVVSIRINPAKFSGDPVSYFPGAVKVPWSDTGYYLPSRPRFILDPVLHAGGYYVQEASSMFIEQCLKQHADLNSKLNVLDLCGAPGGKSTLILSVINESSLLVSNEVIKTRVNVLTENLTKWGAANVIVTNNDPSEFSRLQGFFDVMVVDAPCSGSGLFRRDEDAINQWSREAVKMCSLRQQRILTDAYDSLKQGGLLVYSTCSYSAEENEDMCDWLTQTFELKSLSLKIDPLWNVIETRSVKSNIPGYRFFPDKIKGEGFFVACFRKEDGADKLNFTKSARKLVRTDASNVSATTKWIQNPAAYSMYDLGDDIFAFPRSLENGLAAVHSQLYIRKAGVRLGKIVKNDLVPDHELAISQIVSENLPSILLNKDNALQYLRKEEVRTDSRIKGWALVLYENRKLGWIKLLGNRSNNYYPKEWRILKSGNN